LAPEGEVLVKDFVLEHGRVCAFATVFVFCSLLAISFPPVASADGVTTYTYTGQPFSLNGVGTVSSYYPNPAPVCPPECDLTGYFTVAGMLLTPTLNGTIPVDPISFSFTDGIDTLNNSNATISLSVSTDAAGNIFEWFVNIDGTSGLESYSEFYGSATEATDGVYMTGAAGPSAYLEGHRGTWSVSVPEPSALLLFAIGLLAFVGAACTGSTGGTRRRVSPLPTS